MTSLYDTLNVDPNADKDQIKKAFRKRAQETHPDQGGDEEAFHQVAKAYDVMKDDERRKKYDETGDTEDKVQQDPVEKATAELFRTMVNQGDFSGDIIQSAIGFVIREQQALDSNLGKNNQKKRAFEKQLGRVCVNDDEINLFEGNLQQVITALSVGIAKETERRMLLDSVLERLAAYEDTRPEIVVPETRTRYVTFTTGNGIFT